MYKFYVFLFLFICCSPKNLVVTNTMNKFSKEPFIHMKRTACYGTCPQYEISIYNNGLIQYDGKAFVDRLNCFQAILDDNVIVSIKEKLENVNFFDFEQEYISPVTDIPSVILKVNLGQGAYNVVDRLNGPKELKSLHSFCICFSFISEICIIFIVTIKLFFFNHFITFFILKGSSK